MLPDVIKNVLLKLYAINLTESNPMSKKEYILAFKRPAAEATAPLQGINEVAEDDLSLVKWAASLAQECVIAPRDWVEVNPDLRHPIPYIVLHRINANNEVEVYVYRRVKGVGETKLLNFFTIGLGGHVGASNLQFVTDDAVDVLSTLLSGAVQELVEEVSINGLGFDEYMEQGGKHSVTYGGFIRDDANTVGQAHLGFLLSIGLPDGTEVLTLEPELEHHGWVTLNTLTGPDHEFEFEPWSQIVLDNFAAMEGNNQPDTPVVIE